MTIPKLELQAALYSVRLRKLIIDEHDIVIDRVQHWTDSVTVLQWLHGADKKQNVFVANRVAEIIQDAPVDQWRHVRGPNNPADIGTRGMTMEALKEMVNWAGMVSSASRRMARRSAVLITAGNDSAQRADFAQ